MTEPREEDDYYTRVFSGPGAVGAAAWNGLVAASRAPVFLRAEFLDALHDSGAANPASGWIPEYFGLMRGDRLVAAVPLYRKHHSWGEYVFDWAWAQAHEQHGLPYYPKWLVAVPFTPVSGPRLLGVDPPARAELGRRLLALAQDSGLSSLHVLFPDPAEAESLAAQGLLLRRSVQFHWFNRGWAEFDDFLDALTQVKRKKIRAERRRLAAAGVSCEVLAGSEIGAADWNFFYRCYAATYERHRATPHLPPAFFHQLAATLPTASVMVVARRGGRPIASALALRDGDRLYGRYWGAIEAVDYLHFELSYYQLIAFALREGLASFEGGAQGEHKLARGFQPVLTHSAHWIAHPALRAAVARFVQRESDGVVAYRNELEQHSALRQV